MDIPKNASQTIGSSLRRHFDAKRTGWHNATLTKEQLGYFKFCVIRHPYTRMFSLWWNTVGYGPVLPQHAHYFPELARGMQFHDFVYWVCKTRPEHTTPRHEAMLPPQSWWFRQLSFDAWLRFEHLEEDFNKLPFVKEPIELEHINPSLLGRLCPGVLDVFSFHAADMIYEWARADFELFGFSRDLLLAAATVA